ncbi:hypothetical protein ACVW16_005432 [Bradyrhizobium sp. USDA 4474]
MRVPVEAQNKAAHVLAAKIPDQFIGLFLEPDLLEGEDPKLYWNMVSAVIDEHRPQGFLDWSELIDLVTTLWGERVLRRATNAIIRGGKRLAVEQFLTDIRVGEDGLPSTANRPDRRANKYFSANKKERDEVRSQLAKYGVGEAEVLARSAQNNGDVICMFERMISSRERSRRKLQKEMRRRRSYQEVQSEPYAGANAHRQRPRGSCQEVAVPENVGLEARDRGQVVASRELTATTSEEVHLYHMSKSRSCQEVKTEADRDEHQHNLERLGSCQEVKAKMGGEARARHHGN